jgi:hypothetical protein
MKRALEMKPWSAETILWLGCLSAALMAACGGGDETASNALNQGPVNTAGTKTQPSGAGGNLPSTPTGMGGAAGSGVQTAGGNTQNQDQLLIEPPTATLTITQQGTTYKQPFVAKVGTSSTGSAVTASWKLDNYQVGNIDTSGTFSTSGIVGGVALVTAEFNGKKATAKLNVIVKLKQDLPGSEQVSMENKNALEGTPTPEPAGTNASKILYPYDGTIMPRGLLAPLVQFSPGDTPPQDAKLRIYSTYFSWEGLLHFGNGAVPQASIPQDLWDAATQSAGGETLTVEVIKGTNGQAFGPLQTHVKIAPASLKGAVYYMTYHEPVGVYSVRPGKQEPAKQLTNGCVVCHSVSANGRRLSTGAEVGATESPASGVYNVGPDGSATQLTGTPPGLGGDTRGLSFATFTPDGKYVMRSQNDFWGGVNQKAWRIDDAPPGLTEASVVGLGDQVSALLPAFSPNGKRYVFTNGPGETTPVGTPSRSLSVMDVSTNETVGTAGTLTFSNRQVIVDNGPGGKVTKFATFLPDSSYLVLQEGTGYQTAFSEMLPTWDAASTYTGSTGRLFGINTSTLEHIELKNLNQGIAPIDEDRNYEPFALPVPAGGYFWVVFTSIREYGNTYQGSNVRKQLWVAAINANPAPGEDPSHPPFYIPNQTDTPNERGFWALEPCKSLGNGCDTGDECCDGFCRLSDPNDPLSAKVCSIPEVGTCSQTGEKCSVSGDCCGVGQGIQCIGGFCSQVAPK